MGVCRAYDDGRLDLVVGAVLLTQLADVPQEHPQLHQRQRMPQDGLQGITYISTLLNWPLQGHAHVRLQVSKRFLLICLWGKEGVTKQRRTHSSLMSF